MIVFVDNMKHIDDITGDDGTGHEDRLDSTIVVTDLYLTVYVNKSHSCSNQERCRCLMYCFTDQAQCCHTGPYFNQKSLKGPK